MHRGEAGGGAHPDAAIFDDQITALDERHAHFAGQEDVFEIGGIVHAGGEQDDLRIGHARRGNFGQSLLQAHAVAADRANLDAVHQIGKQAPHHIAVFQHVGDAGGRAGVIFQHQELALFVADDIDAADMHVGAVRHVQPDHFGAEIAVAEHQGAGDHAVVQDALLVVDVADEGVERGHALPHAAFDHIPFGGGEHAGDQVERQDAVDGVLIRIDGEGDALVEQLGLGEIGTAAQFGRLDAADALGDQRHGGIMRRAIHQFAEEFAALVAIQQPVGRQHTMPLPRPIRRACALCDPGCNRPGIALGITRNLRATARRRGPHPRPATDQRRRTRYGRLRPE
jgi:hypothetical protein